MKMLFAICLFMLGAQASALEVNDQAPCVDLQHVSPDNSISEHCIRDRNQNQKYTLIEFFSISCSDCQANQPRLVSLGEAVISNATTRMVSIDRNITAVEAYINQNRAQLPFEIALDSARDAKKAYGVVATPTLFILDENNKIVFKHVGVLTSQDVTTIKTLVLGN